MKITYLSLLLLLVVVGCAPSGSFNHSYASGHYVSSAEQCVPYARSVSGINLYGDADSWWWEARNHYQRGHTPVSGAVLVLKKTSHMHSGHVAVVKNVLGARKINVTHSNWGDSNSTRRIIYDSMLVEDVSAAGDWTEVRFWNDAKGIMGFPYAAYGFIYP
jgi:surface antigen